ncbi:MAG TPA: hypothetical protein VFF76_04355 [Holophagaceae bacterium]|jgi:hypothetical protein|nr:hypothetical protein [Holophagaceae bacterium]
MLSLLTLLLAPSPALLPPEPSALIRQDDQEGRGRGHRDHEDGEGDREDRHERHDRRQDYGAWKREHMDEENSWRKWAKHHHEEDDEDEGHDWDFDHPRHAHPCPPWMNPWWGNQPGTHYVAVVPNDPSRCYVYLDGRWVLRRIGDVDFQVDMGDVMRLPAAPPPIPLPRIGLNLHVVLFN